MSVGSVRQAIESEHRKFSPSTTAQDLIAAIGENRKLDEADADALVRLLLDGARR